LVSDKATDLIARDHLADLLHASTTPEIAAHTIPRTRLVQRGGAGAITAEMDSAPDSISPLAVFFVLAMLITVFVAIVKL
jgi:hypothetical protein